MLCETPLWNDAGLLREFFTNRCYGKVLEFGSGIFEDRRNANIIVNRIAVLTGMTIAAVTEDLLADYRNASL